MTFARLVVSALPAAALALLLGFGPAAAQAPRSPPAFDPLGSAFTETEIGGLGCLTATVGSGLAMVGLVGGPGAMRAAMVGVTMSPRTVLEVSAALAFVFSSACYVGQALAPVISLGATEVGDRLAAIAHR
jgi:hypothetical protein